MGNRNRLSISFKKEHQYIYEHLQGILNKSDFIAKALEMYIRGGEQSSITHSEVRRIVEDILKEQSNLPQTFTQPLPPPDNQITQEDADLLSQLF